jgi:PAS domain S-box-containing protein
VNLKTILKIYREQIITDWIENLHSGLSERYRKRPLDELRITVAAAYDASHAVLIHDDFSKIDCHIGWITKTRLEGGFSLSEVQNAYELYRVLLLPILVKELKGIQLYRAVEQLNRCLFYTITRYSNYFQSLHETEIKEHAVNLEREVDSRTKELAESESKYRVLVEEINDGYFVNQNGNIIFANKAYCDIHGYKPAEVIGRPYLDFIAHESKNEVKELYEDRIANNKQSQNLYMYYRLHKNGTSFPTENKVKLIMYQGKPAVAGICRDITIRMEMERQIRESENLAHIGQLATSLAHEIRNPLSSVKMNIQILLKNVEFNGNDKRRMEIMSSEISRLEKILAEMLDFAKPLRLYLEPTLINDIIETCLDIMDVKIKEKNITVKKKYSKGMARVMIDRDKLEQAIINVLLNSVEALSPGGEIRILTKKVMTNGGSIRVEITDDGPGIGEEDLPYVFDPFFSNKKKGTGLGLANTKKIIEAHGGWVSISARRQPGTHFALSIPFSKTI